MATDWHRFLGLLLTDFFTGTDYQVEIEKDLSAKKQLLDVVVVRKGDAPLKDPLPDGMEDFAEHNLITFKSFQEALDDWALKELTGHYVNYRKQVSPTMRDLLSEDRFRLYALCSRYPSGLAREVTLAKVRTGVYEYLRGTDRIRIIVAGKLTRRDRNAIPYMMSGKDELIRYGAERYRQHSPDSSTLIQQLINKYIEEGVPMPYTMEDFRREVKEKVLRELTPEERLKDLPPEERVKDLSPEERVKDLPAEERLKGLSVEEIERYLKKLKGEGRSRGTKKGADRST